MLEKRSWDEFQSAGLLWFVNRFLHLFGWALVVSVDDNDKVIDCYPAHCKFRGFTQDVEEAGFKKLSDHLAENIERIQKDAHE